MDRKISAVLVRVKIACPYLCIGVFFFIFFIMARALESGTTGFMPLMSNGERNWRFLGTLRRRSPSKLSIDLVKGTSNSMDWKAICWDRVATGVIMTKSCSSSGKNSSCSGASLPV
jgi:hypothetical protein